MQGRRDTDSFTPLKLVPKIVSDYTLEINSKNN